MQIRWPLRELLRLGESAEKDNEVYAYLMNLIFSKMPTSFEEPS
jgi:hypothetical protein